MIYCALTCNYKPNRLLWKIYQGVSQCNLSHILHRNSIMSSQCTWRIRLICWRDNLRHFLSNWLLFYYIPRYDIRMMISALNRLKITTLSIETIFNLPISISVPSKYKPVIRHPAFFHKDAIHVLYNRIVIFIHPADKNLKYTSPSSNHTINHSP